jgi:nucleoside-diphosphate-sugar epimerase
MNILITGNLGYVGPSVVRQLRRAFPHGRLIGLDLGLYSGCIAEGDFLPECMVDAQYFADIRTASKSMFAGIDQVVHLAGISNDPIGNKFESITYEINHKGSVSLAQKAKEAGVKGFIFASSCSIYGFAEDGAKTEESSVLPLTAYAKSKVLTEKDLEKMADRNFRVTCLRFSTACGMSDRLRLDLVLNDFVACAVTCRTISILSDGTPWRPLINIKDMARAVEWAIGRDEIDDRKFLAVNVGCDQWNYQVKDLAAAVAAMLPGVEVTINQNAAPDKRSYRVDFRLFEKLARQHQPECSLSSTIQELKAGLERMNFTDSRFRESSRFIRLNTINMLMDKGYLAENLCWQNRTL